MARERCETETSSIAKTWHCAPPTVGLMLHAVDARGLACVPRGSSVPITVKPVLNAEKRAQLRAILHQSPRTCGQPARVWTLKRLAAVCHKQGLSDAPLACPTMLDAIARLGVSWPRAKHWMVSPNPAYERKKRRNRLSQMTANHPDMALGCEDDVWESREAQPQMQAWSDDTPVRLVEQTVLAQAPEGKAVACDGLYVPTANQMLWRFVRRRAVSVVTCAFLAWLAVYFTAQGKRALVRIWDPRVCSP